jgi:hypothetical protein
MHCWYDLNIDKDNIFRNQFNLPNRDNPAPTEKIIYFYQAHEVFDEKWLSYVKTLGFPTMSLVILFYTPTTSLEEVAHVDWLPDGRGPVTYGINITLDDNDGDMFWYEPPTNDLHMGDSVKGEDNKYTWYNLSGLTQTDRCHIDNTKFTLVNTTIPHYVATGSVDRWCFSLRFSDCTLPWEEVVEKYKSLIIPRDPIEN